MAVVTGTVVGIAALYALLNLWQQHAGLKSGERLGMAELGFKEKTLEADIKGKEKGIKYKQEETTRIRKETRAMMREKDLTQMQMANQAMNIQASQNQAALITQMIQAMTQNRSSGQVAPMNPNVPIHTFMPR